MSQDKQWLSDRTRMHLRESIKVKQAILQSGVEKIIDAAMLISWTFENGGKLLLCGNGGSAADCQHLAAEFVSRLTVDFQRPGLPAIALTTDTSFLTAYANDCGYDGVFARQVQALGRPGDLLLGLSTSGNSKNVILAVEAAREIGMKVLILSGKGGELPLLADIALCIPSDITQYIQEAHITIEHILCDLTERSLFAEKGRAAELTPVKRESRSEMETSP